jgi:hypothetical protein
MIPCPNFVSQYCASDVMLLCTTFRTTAAATPIIIIITIIIIILSIMEAVAPYLTTEHFSSQQHIGYILQRINEERKYQEQDSYTLTNTKNKMAILKKNPFPARFRMAYMCITTK